MVLRLCAYLKPIPNPPPYLCWIGTAEHYIDLVTMVRLPKGKTKYAMKATSIVERIDGRLSAGPMSARVRQDQKTSLLVLFLWQGLESSDRVGP